MLTVATLGMFAYGTYSIAWAVSDLVQGAQLELWAELGLVGFGLLLILAAAFVRVRMPGGLAVAIGAMLGLQALAVHNAAHLDSGIESQVARGVVAFFLVGCAVAGEGTRQEQRGTSRGVRPDGSRRA